MPGAVPFSQMIASVQVRTNTDFQLGNVTLPIIREHLNYGIADLYDRLIAARGQDRWRKTFAITSQSNQSAYPIAADTYEIVSVDAALGANIVISARPYQEEERNRFRFYPGWFYNQPIYYRLIGQSTGPGEAASIPAPQINFIPTPQGPFSITVNYYPVFTPFALSGSTDSSFFEGINGWEEYAIWSAVAAIKDRIEEDPSFAVSRMMDIREKIQALAPQFDTGTAERMHDTEAEWDVWWLP